MAGTPHSSGKTLSPTGGRKSSSKRPKRIVRPASEALSDPHRTQEHVLAKYKETDAIPDEESSAGVGTSNLLQMKQQEREKATAAACPDAILLNNGRTDGANQRTMSTLITRLSDEEANANLVDARTLSALGKQEDETSDSQVEEQAGGNGDNPMDTIPLVTDHSDEEVNLDETMAANDRELASLPASPTSIAEIIKDSDRPAGRFLRRHRGISMRCRELLAHYFREQTKIETKKKRSEDFDLKRHASNRSLLSSLGRVPDLLISPHFSHDQLWQQLEARNGSILVALQTLVKEKAPGSGHWKLKNGEVAESGLQGSRTGPILRQEQENGETVIKKRVQFADLLGSGDLSIDTQKENGASAAPVNTDVFFCQEDLEAFANDAESLALQGKLFDSADETSDSSVGDSGNAEEYGAFDEDAGETKDKFKYRYDDFFDAQNIPDVYNAGPSPTVPSFLQDSDDSEGTDGEHATPLQKSRVQLRKKIEAIEDANVDKRPWALRGEVSAFARPRDSLLKTDMEHDINVPTKAVESQDVTTVLEGLIKQRIADGLFDDVVEAAPEHYGSKKRTEHKEVLPEVSQEKPVESLADMYAREFTEEREFKKKETLASATAQKESDEPLNDAQVEVNQLLKKLAKKLDSLSSLHFAPLVAEVEKETPQSNVKAITVEEVIPEGVSDKSLLAPKEVHATDHRVVKGEMELTKDDRKAKRQRNKAKKRKSNAADAALQNTEGYREAEKKKAEAALLRRSKKIKVTHGNPELPAKWKGVPI